MKDNIIYDPTLDKEYMKKIYESMFRVEVAKQYNIKEMIDISLETGNYGFWHEVNDAKINIPKYYDENGKLKKEFRKDE